MASSSNEDGLRPHQEEAVKVDERDFICLALIAIAYRGFLNLGFTCFLSFCPSHFLLSPLGVF